MKAMRNKLWTLPLLLLLSGIVSRYLFTFGAMRFFILKTPGADGVTNVSISPSYYPCSAVFNLLLLTAVGLLLRRLCDRKTILKSAWIMVAYEFLVLAAEQIAQKLGLSLYPVIWYLYLPGEAFSSMGNHILQMLPIDGWLWPWAILSSFFPLLFIPFGKKPLPQADTAE